MEYLERYLKKNVESILEIPQAVPVACQMWTHNLRSSLWMKIFSKNWKGGYNFLLSGFEFPNLGIMILMPSVSIAIVTTGSDSILSQLSPILLNISKQSTSLIILSFMLSYIPDRMDCLLSRTSYRSIKSLSSCALICLSFQLIQYANKATQFRCSPLDTFQCSRIGILSRMGGCNRVKGKS